MLLTTNPENSTITLTPVEDWENEVLKQIASTTKPNDIFHYGGCNTKEKFTVKLHFGSERKWVTKVINCVQFETLGHIGGTLLELKGSNTESDQKVKSLRDSCYFSRGKPVFIQSNETEGKTTITITLNQCKLCNGPTLSLRGCEWSVCDSCASVCQHNFKRGPVHGGRAGEIAIGEFCSKCGFGNPDYNFNPNKVERELEVEDETGVKVRWSDGPFKGPRQFKEFKDLVNSCE